LQCDPLFHLDPTSDEEIKKKKKKKKNDNYTAINVLPPTNIPAQVSVVVCVPSGSSSVLSRSLSLSSSLSSLHPSLVTSQCVDLSVSENDMRKKRVVLEEMEVEVGQAQGNSSVVWPGSTDIANVR
jgi:hypothetical protein